MKRSLILAGGGMKVGWQAGVMQVLLDEAGLKFDHIDAASGGVLNLSMLLSGSSATEIAEKWGSTSPFRFMSPHKPWRYLLPWKLPSLVTLNAIKNNVLPRWGVDFEKITNCTEVNGHPTVGTFNVTDFGAKRLKVIPHTRMDVDYLLAAISLPGFFPPVFKDGTIYTDAVFLKDQNIAEAVRRGADEIWVIWTVNDETRWKGSFYNQYFHIVETTSNGSYKLELDEIEKINHRVHTLEATGSGTSGGKRHITVHEIRPDSPIPIDYLLWFRKKSMRNVVEMGRQHARDYLIGQGYLEPAPQAEAGPGMRFTETMIGYFTPGEANYETGYQRGEAAGHDLEFVITITVSDLDSFLVDPEHTATAEGVVRSSYFGGTCLITKGEFNLFNVDEDNVRHMEYALEFKTANNKRCVLKGFKTIKDDSGLDPWPDTTTLMTQVVDMESNALVGSGILRITVSNFLRQLMTFRAVGTSSAAESVTTMVRWQVLHGQPLGDLRLTLFPPVRIR